MKISVFSNFLLRLAALILIGVAGFVILGLLNVFDIAATIDFARETGGVILTVIVAFVVALLALKLLFTFGAGKREYVPQSVLLRTTANGNINISLNTVDEITQRFVRSDDNVRDMKSNINASGDGGVKITLRVALRPDVKIPDVMAALQEGLKENVETISGLSVIAINILVDSVTKTYLNN